MSPNLNQWLIYFQENATDKNNTPWECQEKLTQQEYKWIKNSIAAFQLGEYSEGKGLIRAVKQQTDIQEKEKLTDITRLFVKEEQNHALLLKRFMEKHDIPVVKTNWTDSVFRKLRKDVSYELSITVLITAEIIALTYYKALQNCTNSIVLKSVCEKILKDELAHVNYESEVLNYIRSQKSSSQKFIIICLHQLLFLGTIIVVYFNHRQVLKHGNYSFGAFWQACWQNFFVFFGTLPSKNIIKVSNDNLLP